VISPGEALAGVALPAGVALALGVAARFLASPSSADSARPAWGGAALALAAAAGHAGLALLLGKTLLPPRDGFHWVLWYTLAVGIVLLLPLAERWRWLPLTAITAGFWWLAITPLHPQTIATVPALALAAGLTVAAIGLGRWCETATSRWSAICLASAATTTLGATALAAALAGSLVQGQLAGCAAAAAAGLVLAWPWARAQAGMGWAVVLIAAAQAGSKLSWLYSDLTWPAAALLLAALPAGLLAGLPWFSRHPRLQLVARWGIPALFGAAAVAWTLLWGQPAAAAGGPSPY
jgi:hypothetical protein